MPRFTTTDGVSLFYNDWGKGKPVLLIHGWPLSSDFWEYQARELAENGFRVIAYDRRGFGRSDQPWSGYEYDTLARDCHELIEKLDLQEVALVGFSMGGGEIARYLRQYGSKRVSKCAFVAAITPFLLKTEDNPLGVDKQVFEEIVSGLKTDRPGYLQTFAKGFFNVGPGCKPVSQGILDWYFELAMQASAKATIDCANAWSQTDFREDLRSCDVPSLILHGAKDVNVSPETTSRQAAKIIKDSKYIEYENSGHAIIITDAERTTKDLIQFLQQ